MKIWPPALLFVGLGLVLHITGYMIQEPRLSIVALFTGIYGLMGLAWGPTWLRHSFFPFCLFIFSVPMSVVLEPITFPLRLLVSALVEWIAHGVLGIGVMRMGTQLFDPLGTYQYDVAAACSGIRSLTAIFLFATVWGFIAFRSPWKRGLMMALAIPFAILGNLLRMLLIILAAVMGGQSWGNYVHEGCPIHLPFSLPLIGNEIAIVNLLPYVPAFVGLLLVGAVVGGKTRFNRRPATMKSQQNPDFYHGAGVDWQRGRGFDVAQRKSKARQPRHPGGGHSRKPSK